MYIIYSHSSEVKHSIWLYNSLYSSCTLFILSLQKWNIQFDYNSLYSSCTLFIISLQKWNIQFDYIIHCTQVVHYLFSLFRSETFNLIIEFIVLKLYIIYSQKWNSSEVKHSIWLYNSLYSSCTLFILSLQKWNIQFD